ncbi:MAG: DUF2271 domain-containing protein [Myxococcota bacterium]|nr:DUF2271 domain-containing protein [Myxococcota bacterium]
MGRNHWIGAVLVVCLLGAFASPVEAKGSVRVTFTTTPAPQATYTPNNVVAVWIQNAGGQHQRTIGRWSDVRTQYLLAYRAAATANDTLTPDAVTGASRLNHQGSLSVLWNLRDKAGVVVPDGTYTIRLELAESNATTQAQNNEGTFTFVKGPNPQTQTALTNGGFTNVTITYDPEAVACGDGVADAPETCDYTVSGSCIVNQSGCTPAIDKCMPVVFQGDPMMCTADCVPQAPITTCVAGDGCCPDGCDEASDIDCRPGGTPDPNGNTSPDVSGGCAAAPSGSLFAFALFGVLVLLGRRRR